MNKEHYIKKAKELFTSKSLKLVLDQIDNYYNAMDNYKQEKSKYKINDQVHLKKGTLLHGTYRNIEGLKGIIENGLIASVFIGERTSKYPSTVGVWNLKKDYSLKDYINFYSGGTIRYYNMFDAKTVTEVVPYNDMKNIMNIIKSKGFQIWKMEQTKEARFMPSLIQDNVQIGIVFSSNNSYIDSLKKNDIINEISNEKIVKPFMSEYGYEGFIKNGKNKDDFFTDRESAILFGIPSCFIEGVLVGRIYEKDKTILEEIKKLLPNAYICNLDGIVIK